MAQKSIRKRALLGCTVLLALTLFANASDHLQQEPLIQESSHFEVTAKDGSQDVDTFKDNTNAQDKIEHGKQLYLEAMQLLESSNIKIEDRVFTLQQSSLARSFLSDELQKQKGILPTALRLVTQGVMSFFKPTSTSSSTTTPKANSPLEKENEGNQDPADGANTKVTVRRHRDPVIAKAIDLLRTAGYDFENDDALWTLANILFHGQYKSRRDFDQSFDLYATLADRSGNATAQQMIGFMYSTGLGSVVERDEAKAILYTSFAAWANNTAAELTMGYKYMLGIGTKKSCDDSVFYYKRAADKAHDTYLSGPPLGRTMPPIKVRLTDSNGGTYGAGASGSGAPSSNALASDIKDFIQYHQYIAEGDSLKARAAQYLLGVLFYTGNAKTTTIPRDYQKAGKYLRRVADAFFNAKMTTEKAILEAREQRRDEADDAGVAAALLGKMYWRGEGYAADELQALNWFKKGALLGNPVALNGLGTMYAKGTAGLSVDFTRATQYFKMAADQNYPDAQVNMGLIYVQDPKHYSKALHYFEEASKSQNFQAIYRLGEMYYYGLGVPKHCERAAGYFKYVAERGDWDEPLFHDAHQAYQAGDIEYAAVGYLQAAERGFEIGQSNFAWIVDRALDAIAESVLVSLGTPSKLLEMALVYWTRSANQGDVDARVKMGDYYFTGIGAEVDFKKATACYQVAAEVELSAMAMWNLGWMHENGVGAAKDFHLAKQWYDMSLTTNPGALLPVSLSLAKLNARYIWNYLTGGDTGADSGSFWSINGKAPSSSSASSSSKSSKDGAENSAQGGDKQAPDGAADGQDGTAAGSTGSSSGSRKNWDLDEIGENGIENWKSQQQAGPGDADGEYDENDPLNHHHHQRQQRQRAQQGDREDEDVVLLEEEDLVEGMVIIGLCMVIGYLMYVRQFRFGQQGQQQNADQNDNNNNNQPPVQGLPGDPNAPGRFAYYAAGG
ncbi:ERAD-associated protein [Mortierella polycephala]|uniref:ERAD-associated protein n=1 Tax=Mortierella polycephala TaxID=41804 RepID=A0A9P6Q8I6_9FUNG|nr:ERAD-associated protein [Mortierella polycephala]